MFKAPILVLGGEEPGDGVVVAADGADIGAGHEAGVAFTVDAALDPAGLPVRSHSTDGWSRKGRDRSARGIDRSRRGRPCISSARHRIARGPFGTPPADGATRRARGRQTDRSLRQGAGGLHQALLRVDRELPSHYDLVVSTDHLSPTVFGHEKSELDELPKALDANPGALRNLLFG
jgi:hypothetical protein